VLAPRPLTAPVEGEEAEEEEEEEEEDLVDSAVRRLGLHPSFFLSRCHEH
jgi:hypothetical protein